MTATIVIEIFKKLPGKLLLFYIYVIIHTYILYYIHLILVGARYVATLLYILEII